MLSVTGGSGHRIKANLADVRWALFEKSLLTEKSLSMCMLDTKRIHNIMWASIKPFNLDRKQISRVFNLIHDDEVAFIGPDVTMGEEQASATWDLARARRAEGDLTSCSEVRMWR